MDSQEEPPTPGTSSGGSQNNPSGYTCNNKGAQPTTTMRKIGITEVYTEAEEKEQPTTRNPRIYMAKRELLWPTSS